MSSEFYTFLDRVSDMSKAGIADVDYLNLGRNLTGLHDETLLHFAAVEGFIKEVRFLGGNGWSCDVQNSIGSTPLIDAVVLNNAKMVSCLLELGADPNFRDKNGNTALHYSNRPGRVRKKISKLLAKFGADFSAVNNHGEKPGEFEF